MPTIYWARTSVRIWWVMLRSLGHPPRWNVSTMGMAPCSLMGRPLISGWSGPGELWSRPLASWKVGSESWSIRTSAGRNLLLTLPWCAVASIISVKDVVAQQERHGRWMSLSNSRVDGESTYSLTPVLRTSVIRNLDYPNTVPNVESGLKKNGILTKIADSATEQSTCVCVSYIHVQCRHTVVRHRVQCEV